MRMAMVAGLFLAALLLTVSTPAAAQPRGVVYVTCESIDQRDQYCPVNTRGYVRMVRQKSRAGCWEGETWGWDRRGIWVTRGCRAEFEVGGGPEPGWRGEGGWDDDRDDDRYRGGDDRRDRDGYDPRDRSYGGGQQRVVCESRDYRYRYCPVRGGVRDADLVDQYSNSECRYDRSWGYDRGGIWVDRGCAAEFVVID
jgi:hypothetical protein